MMALNRIYRLYLELCGKHGDPKSLWPQWCADKKGSRLREIIAIGAILAQRTSWHNADLALKNLKKARLLSLEKIASLKDLDVLKELTRPAGFYQTKPKRLFGLACFIIKECGSLKNFIREDLKAAREKLLNLYGIGPETADTILLYAMDKPSFVIDEYTKRLAGELKLSKTLTYDYLKELFEKSLPKSADIYQDFHALIIIDQRGRKASAMRAV